MSDMTMPQVAKERPKSVIGPDGKLLTLDDLPPPDTQRWVARRKAEVYALASGVRLGPVEWIMEHSGFGPPVPMRAQREAAAMGAVPIATGDDTLGVTVTVGFKIAQ